MCNKVVPSIHFTTGAHLLAEVSLHPHRSRYWKTARVDAESLTLAAKVPGVTSPWGGCTAGANW
jgi:hypothetical protein